MRISLSLPDWSIGLFVLPGSLEVGLYMAYRGSAGKNSSSFFLGGRKTMTKLAFTLFAGALVMNSLPGWNVMTTVFYTGMIVAVLLGFPTGVYILGYCL